MQPLNLDEMPEIRIAEGVFVRPITGHNITVLHVRFEAGAVAPAHSHYHEQIVNVVEGELEFSVSGRAHRLAPGMAMVLPSNVPHAARAVTACRVVDVFHPVREEFREPDKAE